SNQVYLDKLLQIKELFKNTGKDVSFLFCSNEKIDKNLFKEINVNFGTGHLLEDLYSLAECDYIIGPPSTFSSWASFYGNVPLLQLLTKDQKIEISDFVSYKS
ncbi:MAG: hypothetical protein OEV44_11315, partial [Spirochaetota bacterium]|nr:hypothetical protein [Spirochaetota bacterium]